MRVSINMGKNAQAMQSTTTAQSDIGYKEKKNKFEFTIYISRLLNAYLVALRLWVMLKLIQ